MMQQLLGDVSAAERYFKAKWEIGVTYPVGWGQSPFPEKALSVLVRFVEKVDLSLLGELSCSVRRPAVVKVRASPSVTDLRRQPLSFGPTYGFACRLDFAISIARLEEGYLSSP